MRFPLFTYFFVRMDICEYFMTKICFKIKISVFFFLPDNSHIERAESPPSEILNDRSPTYFAETDVGWSNGSKNSTVDVDEKSRQKRIEEEDRLAVPSPPPEDDEVKTANETFGELGHSYTLRSSLGYKSSCCCFPYHITNN